MDNLYKSCPQRMAYGGVWTDHRPRCVANVDIARLHMSSEQYRQSLIENGALMIEHNRAFTESKYGCFGPIPVLVPGFAVTQECYNNVCTFRPNSDSGGIGLGK